MSSETSTDANSFRPWHLFVLAGLLASTLGVIVVRPGDPVVLLILVAAIGSAAGVGFALYRALWPLVATDFTEQTQIIDGRARAAIEREKTLVLRSIKELEFDRAMGKVSDTDFELMGRRLRAHALALMKQLDVDLPGYRDVIERELVQRLAIDLQGDDIQPDIAPAADRPFCASCGTENDADAKFCKGCAAPMGGAE
jgi:hypothetical protein